MLRTAPLALLSLAMLLAAACIEVNVFGDKTIESSGEIETRSYDFAGFTGVVISHAFTADVEQGDDFAIKVTFDRNLRNELEVDVRGGRLYVGLSDVDLRGNVVHSVEITMPALASIEASGASHVSLGGFEDTQGELDVRLSGASQVFGDLVVGLLVANLSGASSISLAGSAGRVDLDGAGASSFSFEEFDVASATIALSGASGARVVVAEQLGPVRLSGGSALVYAGDPEITGVQATGGSTIRPQ